MTRVIRFIGYWLGMVVTDIAIGMWEDRRMEREFSKFSNDNGGEVSAHVVTEDTAGPVMTVGGTSRDVAPGDVLLATDRADVYHVADSSALDEWQEADDNDSADVVESDQDSDQYDPSQYSAQEVRAYLTKRSDAGDTAEVERVLTAERAGLNRATVVRFDR